MPQVNASKLLFIGVGVAFLTILVVLLLASMFLYTSGNGLGVFRKSVSSLEAVFSLKSTTFPAQATTLINVVMVTIVALLLVRHDFPFRGIFDSLVDLPIAVAVTGFKLLLPTSAEP